MKILMKPHLDLKVLATSLIPSVISSGEFWFKLFVPHKQLLFKRFWQQEDYEHVIEYPQFKDFRGCKNLAQTFWYRLNPAAIEPPIIIVS